MTKTIEQIFADAADLIDTYGKATGTFRTENGAMCAVGALRLAAGGKIDPRNPRYVDGPYDDRRSMYNEAWKKLTKYVGVALPTVWSDKTSKEEVVSVLRQLAGKSETDSVADGIRRRIAELDEESVALAKTVVQYRNDLEAAETNRKQAQQRADDLRKALAIYLATD